MRLRDLARHAPSVLTRLARVVGPRPKRGASFETLLGLLGMKKGGAGRKTGEASRPAVFGKPKSKSAAAARQADKGRTRVAKPPRPKTARKPRPAAPMGAIDALGFILAAGALLAWPREGGSGWERVRRTVREKGLVNAAAAALAAPLHAQIAARDPQAAALAEPGRGRDAAHPLAIPPGGWADILRRTWSEFNQDRIVATAGGVTFFSLLAMFPALAAFVSLYGLFFDVSQAREHLKIISGFVPHDIVAFIGDEMTRIASGGGGKLGVAFAISLLLSLWSANGAVKALFDGLNVAYGERESRGIVKLNLISLGFTFGALLFTLLAIAAVVAAPAVLGFLHLDAGSVWLAELRWPVLLALLGLGLSAVYRYGPSRQHPRWVWITPGGLLAAVLWMAASLLFSWYVANFGHFNKTYGSLGAVVGFMTWLWYSTIIVLFGAELNAEIEHQTAVDTTTGHARPMGARGAKMADTLGPRPAKSGA